MNGISKTILVCTLGQDPQTHTFDNGDKVTKVSAATSERWKDKQTGEQKEVTEWHKLKFTGALAGIVEQYLRKGSKIYVEGQNKTTKWQDNNGNEKFTTEVVVGMRGQLQMLDSKPDGQQNNQQRQQQGSQQQQGGYQNNNQQAPSQQYQDDDSNIPF